MNDSKLRILLSEGSSTSARQTLYAMGHKYTVDLADPTPLCQCRFSRFVRRRYACPPIGKDPMGYLRVIKQLIRDGSYDIFFPTHEQVYLVAKFREQFEPHVKIAVPEFDVLSEMQGKGDFTRMMERLNIPAPITVVASSESELHSHAEFPCFIKLAHSTASMGVRKVNSHAEVDAAIAEFKRDGLWEDGAEVLLQQPAKGIQSTVNTVFQRGRLIAAHCTETLQTGIGGGSSWQISASHPAAVQHAKRLGEQLNWHGPLFLEYFHDPQVGPQFIEANPRIGEITNAWLCGINLAELTVRIAMGERLEPVGEGTIGLRSHNGFIVLIADAYNGATRRELMTRMWKMWRGKPPFDCQNEMTRPSEDLGSLIPAIATTLRLLVSPRSATQLSKQTVDNYALPQSAINELES